MTRNQIKQVDDGTLVEAMGEWGESALAEAYDRHFSPVVSFSRRVLRDDALAHEVAQETFLHLWANPEKFDASRGSLRSYLLAKARGKSIDVLRSETSRRKREERSHVEQSLVPKSDIAEVIREHSIADVIRREVKSLADKERIPIEMAYFGGHTYREVAERLGIPEGTVKSRIRAGLSRMRSELEGSSLAIR